MEEKKYIKKIHNVSWNGLSEVKDWLEEMALKGYKLVEVKGGNRFCDSTGNAMHTDRS